MSLSVKGNRIFLLLQTSDNYRNLWKFPSTSTRSKSRVWAAGWRWRRGVGARQYRPAVSVAVAVTVTVAVAVAVAVAHVHGRCCGRRRTSPSPRTCPSSPCRPSLPRPAEAEAEAAGDSSASSRTATPTWPWAAREDPAPTRRPAPGKSRVHHFTSFFIL